MSSVLDLLASALAERYRVEREVGAGGMATVFLAHDLKHHRPVAIKVLRQEFASSVSSERFLREIRFIAQLSHPNILPLFDSGNADGLLYYVMPYVAEPTLRDRLRAEGPLPITDCVRLALEIADGLQYAHEQGVIHRDIKPENILLRRGHVLIGDFGIGKALTETDEASVTVTGMIMGTPSYMSPEQATGDRVIDLRSDVYSLGCVLFEMITGTPPFAGSNAYAVLAKHTNEPRPSAAVRRAEVSQALDLVLQKAMAVWAEERFASCAEFARALEAKIGLIATTTHASLPQSNTTHDSVPERTVARRTSRRAYSLYWVACVAILVLATVAAVRARAGIRSFFAGGATTTYSDAPPPSPWTENVGEAFTVIATTDSSLIVHRARARSIHALQGSTWSAFAIPDSFELRPFEGQLHDGRLLATRRRINAHGETSSQLWWLALSRDGLKPVEAVSDFVAESAQPYWWFDGRTLVTWLESVMRRSASGWTREATGASAAVVSMWGQDDAHRFAIAAAPRDSLLVYDGIGWRMRDILTDRANGTPQFFGGASLDDGSTVVFGEQCGDVLHCTPLIMRQDRSEGTWKPVVIRSGMGIPKGQPAEGDTRCVNRLQLTGAGGRSAADFYVWGQWDFCAVGPPPRDDSACPRAQPCVWHVRAGELEPVRELAGKVLLGVRTVRRIDYGLFEDGTVWRDTTGNWRPVATIPNVPLRLTSASAQVVVKYKDNRLTYQPSAAMRLKLVVHPFAGMPSSLTDSMPPRRLAVRDSFVALLAPNGSVLMSRCTFDQTRELQCSTLESLGSPPSALTDIALLPDGGVLAITPRGGAYAWRNRTWVTELLPTQARSERLIRVELQNNGNAYVIGPRLLLQRDLHGRWTVVAHPDIGTVATTQFVVLADGSLVVSDVELRIWTDPATSAPPIILQRRVNGEAQVSALHALPDGRLVVGFANRDEPGVGGWLLVWQHPVREDHRQRVNLPLNVDVTDLADDGQNLRVVGRGGSMAIPLDSLPYSAALAAHARTTNRLRQP